MLARRRLAPALAAALALFGAALACTADYSEEPPPSLDEAPSVDAQRDELLFERQLRWWTPPSSQRVRLYQRDDGSLFLLRDRWDGTAVYAWAAAELTDAGEQRLADALAAVDPERTEPAPGEYRCTYFETLPAIVYFDGEPFEYLSLCPPEGLAELASLYEELVELLLDCPLEPSWYEGELPLAQTDCELAR
ncbi:MAG: hypothetical protein R6X02_01675 [Enhygromyxa sp.]